MLADRPQRDAHADAGEAADQRPEGALEVAVVLPALAVEPTGVAVLEEIDRGSEQAHSGKRERDAKAAQDLAALVVALEILAAAVGGDAAIGGPLGGRPGRARALLGAGPPP